MKLRIILLLTLMSSKCFAKDYWKSFTCFVSAAARNVRHGISSLLPRDQENYPIETISTQDIITEETDEWVNITTEKEQKLKSDRLRVEEENQKDLRKIHNLQNIIRAREALKNKVDDTIPF